MAVVNRIFEFSSVSMLKQYLITKGGRFSLLVAFYVMVRLVSRLMTS